MTEPSWQERLIRQAAEDRADEEPVDPARAESLPGHDAVQPPPPPPSGAQPPRPPQPAPPPPARRAAPPPPGPVAQPAPGWWRQPGPAAPAPPGGWQQPGYPPGPPPQQQQYPAPPPYGEPSGRSEGDGLLRRLGRIASEAAFLAGGSGRMQRDLENIGIIRRPIAITRIIGTVGAVQEAGTSTIAALLAETLGAQRSDRVVAIDADPHQVELSRRLELPVGTPGASRIQLVRCDPAPEAVRVAVGRVAGGSHGVGVAVVDCPAGLTTPVTTYVATTSHALVVSMPSVRHVAEHCLGELDRLGPEGQRLLVAKGVVVVNLVDTQDEDGVRWAVRWLQERGVTTVVMPYDEHLARAWPLWPDRLRPATRRAVLELTARALERSLGTRGGDS